MKARLNGIDIHYDISGEGPWVTLSHSLACDLSMWAPQMAALTARYKVLRYDTRGHGASGAPAGAYSFEQLTDDALALLDHLEIARTHFVGLSMGGMIGQHLALRAPGRLASLTLADTSSRYPADAKAVWEERIRIVAEQGLAPLVEPTLARWFTAAFRNARPEETARIAALILKTPAAGYIGCSHCIPTLDVSARLPALRLPALVIVGEHDTGTPVVMAQEIVAALPGARLAIIPAAAHLSNIEQAEVFNRLLLDFLNAN